MAKSPQQRIIIKSDNVALWRNPMVYEISTWVWLPDLRKVKNRPPTMRIKSIEDDENKK
jgi:hypothetical protein